jgi:hypothetical protein
MASARWHRQLVGVHIGAQEPEVNSTLSLSDSFKAIVAVPVRVLTRKLGTPPLGEFKLQAPAAAACVADPATASWHKVRGRLSELDARRVRCRSSDSLVAGCSPAGERA